MKPVFILLFALAWISLIRPVNAQQVIVSDDATYTSPASGAVLDVKSSGKGFLPPRVALTGRTDATTISSPTTGLLVYNTATTGTSPDNVTPGYYYNSGTTGSPSWTRAMNSDVSNGMSFQDDGSPILNGTATAWNDYVVNPALARNSGGNVPTWALFVEPDIFTWQFADGSDRSVDFSIQLPHDYKPGTTVYPHIHWAPLTAASTQRVLWKIDYQWKNFGDTYVASSGSTTITGYNVVNSTSKTIEETPTESLSAMKCTITPIGTGITGTGKGISSIIMCRLTRVGSDGTSDTYTGNAALLSLDIHYETDTFGSRTEYIK